MTEPVVDRLEIVDIDEHRHEVAVGPASAVDLTLELLEPDAPTTGARQLVGPCNATFGRSVHAIIDAGRAILRCVSPILGSTLTGRCRASDYRFNIGRAAAGLFIEITIDLIASHGYLVSLRSQAVASRRSCVTHARSFALDVLGMRGQLVAIAIRERALIADHATTPHCKCASHACRTSEDSPSAYTSNWLTVTRMSV
jgi:hypothetical protein